MEQGWRELAQEPDCQELIALLEAYGPPDQLELVCRAYALGRLAHAGQERLSGGDYFQHPLAVARILLDLELDAYTTAAALLHDVAEDTEITLDLIYQHFGQEIGDLVSGVTKITRIEERPLKDEQAYNLRKMFLAMSEDVRVILLKLADRLHNMRTLAAMPPEKQRKISDETLEIYAPLAHRLGIWTIKTELEDLAFSYLNPQSYREISHWMDNRRPERARILNEIVQVLEKALHKAQIQADIQKRAKGIYSTYQKSERRGQMLERIYDILAVRIVVSELRECYTALGIVHNLWRPIPGQFDDYIATPKDGIYRSLHTTVLYQGLQPLEVQIRDHDMHREAEYGIAAHWRYKEQGRVDRSFEQKLAWLRETMAWRQEMSEDDARAFVDKVKTQVFHDRVYVFTPKGDIKDLPTGATPVDFAYSIHSEVGHRCGGVRVNGRWVPLSYQLKTGDVVEILTSKAEKGPSRDWLSYVVSPSARAHIRRWFKKRQREENVSRGREILEREFRRLAVELDLRDLTQRMGYNDSDDMLAAIGYGDLSVHQVLSKLPLPRDDLKEELQAGSPPMLPLPPTHPSGIRVQGQRGMLTRLAGCCQPVPGDGIVGYITRGQGITIHRADCHNIRLLESERLIEVDWGSAESKQRYPVQVCIQSLDRVGLLRDVSSLVADSGVNMSSVQVGRHDDGTATFRLILEVVSLDQLSTILQRVGQIPNVLNVWREAGGASRGGV
ncbi:MAG: bifunctional (p)ppGpp synthetase/guanosine-3',5'-bis(diphosphate) 3'-pyrophosphohydrolase [Chloroflexia bacterium]|nr:bifunctional (p)ppGpp synthetase/guanosine-3',5'-bis(diphosphate) 3'-pyrophosphohydrolase [Chloroflexia bacterium]